MKLARQLVLGTMVLGTMGVGLAACGGSSHPAASQRKIAPSQVPEALERALASIGSSPYLQADVSMSGSGSGSSAREIQRLANGLKIEVEESTSGGALAKTPAKSIAWSLVVLDHGQTLASIRYLKAKGLYFTANASQIVKDFHVSVPASISSSLQLLTTGQWLELTPNELTQLGAVVGEHVNASGIEKSILSSMQASGLASLGSVLTTGSPTQTKELIRGAVLYVLDHSLKPVSGGMQANLTGSGVAQQLATYLSKHGVSAPASSLASVLAGSHLHLFLGLGPNDTLQSLEATVGGSTSGGTSVTVDVSLSHKSVTVSAPSSATQLPPSIISEVVSGISASGASGKATPLTSQPSTTTSGKKPMAKASKKA
jgi:hypothetical protein